MPVLVEKIFLLETEPGAGVIKNRGARVGRVRGLLVGHEHLAHDERAVLLGGIGIDGHGLEHAIRGAAFGLAGRAAVEVPPRKLFEFWKFSKFLEGGLAAQVGDGFVTVEPEVF